MSLEAKIEKLTKAVELLTKTILERDVAELAQNIIEPTVEVMKEVVEADVKKTNPRKAEQAPKEEKAEPSKEVTAEDVQAVCLAIVREDSTKKKAIVELLGEYGAKTVGQVKTDKLPELKAKLGAL